MLPWEARPCDWVADPGRLASVLGFGSPRGKSWSSVKLGGSSSKRIQIVIGIPLLVVGDRMVLTTFLVDVPINR